MIILRRKEVWGGGKKRLDKDLVCIHALHMDTDNRVARTWGRVGIGWRGAMEVGGKRGTSVISSTIKIK